MIVLSIVNCTPRLRGDLSKWLLEVNTGVYLGRLSTRVRDEIWKRVCDNIHDGQATMIYPTATAQGYSIKVHNAPFEPVDYDGLTLMRRPLRARGVQPAPAMMATRHKDVARFHTLEEDVPVSARIPTQVHKAAAYRQDAIIAVAERQLQHGHVGESSSTCTIVDIETTGLDCERDFIIEIAAVRVEEGKVIGEYQCLVNQQVSVPEFVVKLTGITEDMLHTQGVEEREGLEGLLSFMGGTRVVGYNTKFDMGFIVAACDRHGLTRGIIKTLDVLWMARRTIKGVDNYRLETIARHLFGDVIIRHRALDDCRIICRVYNKLNEIRDGG